MLLITKYTFFGVNITGSVQAVTGLGSQWFRQSLTEEPPFSQIEETYVYFLEVALHPDPKGRILCGCLAKLGSRRGHAGFNMARPGWPCMDQQASIQPQLLLLAAVAAASEMLS
jgi:hypothetical protein